MSDPKELRTPAPGSNPTEDGAAHRLAAIIESSDDAIVSKDLNGVITSWNQGAERLFGYTAAEVVGKSITIIIPADRLHEEREVLTRIRAGKKVDHFETLRRHKNGTLVPISLTVSPIREADGTVVGASKIARDISYRLEAEAERARLLSEVQRHAAITAKLNEVGAVVASSLDRRRRTDARAARRLFLQRNRGGLWRSLPALYPLRRTERVVHRVLESTCDRALRADVSG